MGTSQPKPYGEYGPTLLLEDTVSDSPSLLVISQTKADE